MIRTIHLDSALQKVTGVSTIQLDANSPQTLIRGLQSQVPNFRQALITHPDLCFVSANKDKSKINGVTAQTFEFPLDYDTDEIYVMTPIDGSAATAIAYLIMEWELSLAVATAVVSVATSIAVNIAVNVVLQALSPSVSTTDGGKATEKPSFLYNGAVNVVEQGYAVPLIYGTHMCGSIVVSAGVDVAELPYASAQDTAPANGGGTTQPTTPPVESYQFDGE